MSWWRVVRFLIAEHALLLLKVVIAAAVDDVPQDVQEQVRDHKTIYRSGVAFACFVTTWTASLLLLYTCIDMTWLASLVVPI
eukprot:COSAG04_NODE_291_length_17813_cov_32.336231_14_plen_82_part_00